MTKKYLFITKINQQETTHQCTSSVFNSQVKGYKFFGTLRGSPETACRIAFQLSHFMTTKPEHNLRINTVFLTWFIGFVEGDGSFVISHNKVYFDLTQDLKDISLLYQIKATLGFGKILTRTSKILTRSGKHRNVGVFYVTGKDNFIRLAHLFNGNLVTSYKKKQFKTWLSILNKQYSCFIENIESDIQPSFKHGWLSGFIDAEGCFAARVKSCHTSKLGKNVLVDFSIAQKQKDVLISIRCLFSIKSDTNIRFDPSWQGYLFYLGNKKKLVPLINYLNKYPLRTKKNANFLMWSKIHNLSKQQIHLTKGGLLQITKLCNWKKDLKS
jgi:hypothetical protein